MAFTHGFIRRSGVGWRRAVTAAIWHPSNLTSWDFQRTRMNTSRRPVHPEWRASGPLPQPGTFLMLDVVQATAYQPRSAAISLYA
jgi:hypothetical protein